MYTLTIKERREPSHTKSIFVWPKPNIVHYTELENGQRRGTIQHPVSSWIMVDVDAVMVEEMVDVVMEEVVDEEMDEVVDEVDVTPIVGVDLRVIIAEG